jgi:hypothetical protein
MLDIESSRLFRACETLLVAKASLTGHPVAVESNLHWIKQLSLHKCNLWAMIPSDQTFIFSVGEGSKFVIYI